LSGGYQVYRMIAALRSRHLDLPDMADEAPPPSGEADAAAADRARRAHRLTRARRAPPDRGGRATTRHQEHPMARSQRTKHGIPAAASRGGAANRTT